MKLLPKISSVAAIVVALMVALVAPARAATAVGLGTTYNFAVLAGSTITNIGPTVITGDLGLSPGTSVTGFPPGTVSGNQHVANAVAVQAQTDLVTAYNDAAGQTPATTIPTELGGTTLTPGIYTSDAGTFGITGTVTLDGQGDPNAVFIFQMASTLTTAGSSVVALVNGTQPCNVFWQVGSSATLGTNSAFRGNIFALTSATLTTGAEVEGRVLARNGAVTLDSNVVTRAVCAGAEPTVPVPTEPTPTDTDTDTDTDGDDDGVSTVVPGLPDAGVPPAAQRIPWQIPAGLVVAGSLLLYAGKKRRVALR